MTVPVRLWGVAAVYDERPVAVAGRPSFPLASGCLAWSGSVPCPVSIAEDRGDGSDLVALPVPAPLLIDHSFRRRCGQVVRWVDRPEALYAEIELDGPSGNVAAAWDALWRSPDGTLSVGVWPVDGMPAAPGDPITKAALYELSVCASGASRHPQTRMLLEPEVELLLAGEAPRLAPVRMSIVDRMEVVGRG